MLELLPTLLSALAGATSTLVYCAWQLSAFSYRLRQVEVETAQLKARHDTDMTGLLGQLSAHRQEVISMVTQHDQHNREDFERARQDCAKLQASLNEMMKMLLEGRR